MVYSTTVYIRFTHLTIISKQESHSHKYSAVLGLCFDKCSHCLVLKPVSATLCYVIHFLYSFTVESSIVSLLLLSILLTLQDKRWTNTNKKKKHTNLNYTFAYSQILSSRSYDERLQTFALFTFRENEDSNLKTIPPFLGWKSFISCAQRATFPKFQI